MSRLKGAMVAAALSVSFVSVMVPSLAPAAITATKLTPTLCKDPEIELFSCPIRNKVVSVCALTDGNSIYRFGRPGHIEMQSRDLHKAVNDYSGGGEDQINFQMNGYTYIVFARTERTGFGPDGHNDPKFTSGLVVHHKGRTILSANCGAEGDQTIDTLATHYMPTGNFIEH